MTARCDLTDLPADMCACRVHSPQPPPAAGVVRELPQPGWMEARFPGACMGCGERFTAGTHIRFDGETGGWIAECCTPTEEA